LITPTQALLARTMLRLSQKEAAAQLDMAHATLSNIENGQSDPPASRMLALQAFYERAGIAFIDGEGVCWRQSAVVRYHGVEGFRSFMDDVYETAKIHGGDICLFNSRPRLWTEHLGAEWYEGHRKRMAALGDHIRVRITVEKGEDAFILSSAEHRWLQRDQWRGKIFYAYGPKLGFLDFSSGAVHITVLEESDFAESFKIMFDVVWEHETQKHKPTKNTKRKEK